MEQTEEIEPLFDCNRVQPLDVVCLDDGSFCFYICIMSVEIGFMSLIFNWILLMIMQMIH